MNEKELIEKRNDLQEKMEGILDLAKKEKRAMNENEVKDFDEMEKEIKDIDATLERNARINKMELKKVEDKKEAGESNLEEVKDQIRAELSQKKQEEAYRAKVDELKKKYMD